MNSVELPASIHFSPETTQWDDVRRTYRRVCVLRATGKKEEAERLENGEFAHALSVAREAADNGDTEATVLAEEAERVSSACVLAELLAPLLAEKLRADAHSFAVAPQVPVTQSVPEKSPGTARPPAENVPSIADLIDGMLSQQMSFPASPARR